MNPGSARVAAAAVPGCQHVLANGKPCQDAVGTRVKSGVVLIAAADGHGDAAYVCSDEGARIAVAVALDVLESVARVVQPIGTDEPARSSEGVQRPGDLTESLKRRVAFEWNRRVKHHARMVANRDEGTILWPAGVTGEWDDAVRRYGCTLLAGAFGPAGSLWFQIGDGDMLNLDSAGVRRVFPAPDKSMGQETWSLSMRDCVERMQVRLDPPGCEMAVLATDGVSDQYAAASDAGDAAPTFEDEWGTKMEERIATRGWADTMLDLPRWLAMLARDGDDASVAIAWLGRFDDGLVHDAGVGPEVT